MSALQKFIASARKLHAEEKDPATRWEKMTPLLQELLADPSVKEQSRSWPDCSQGGERAENLLFYEDPDYKFVINGLIKAPHTRTQIHDHAHNWTLYGVLDGTESIERYERVDVRSKPD
jgi:predicted metal-dependent enzyme (double-stranded beta helix superfamily)